MLFVKDCSGDESEVMFEEVLKRGYETASRVIAKSHSRFDQNPCKTFFFSLYSYIIYEICNVSVTLNERLKNFAPKIF